MTNRSKKPILARIKNIHVRRLAVVVCLPYFIVLLTIAYILQALNRSITEAFFAICEEVHESMTDYTSTMRSILKGSVALMTSDDQA